MQKVTDLGRPTFKNGVYAEDTMRPLMAPRELDLWYFKNGRSGLWWDNNVKDIAETKDDVNDRFYRGFRSKKQTNEWQGLGVMQYKDGSVYQGFTLNKKFNGRGRLTHASGDIYQGDWKDGKAHGKGVYVSKDTGTLYDGDWVQDEQHGHGIELFKFGSVRYEGEYREGAKTGRGKFTTATGHVYEGEFVDGKFHGKGQYYNAEKKRTYIGTFQNNQLRKGTINFEDGQRYEGEILDEKMHGAGVIYYANNDVYVGTFKDD